MIIVFLYRLNIVFLFSTSLPRFVVLDESLIEGVTVFNNIVYSLPDMLHLKKFVNDYYPCKKEFNSNEIIRLLEDTVHYLNLSELPVSNMQSIVFQKMINDSNLELTPKMLIGNKIELQYISY